MAQGFQLHRLEIDTTCSLQVCEAQHCLKVAVKVQHSGSTVTELFICGIADALIEHGLSKRSPTGFRMQWVSFDTIGHQLATLKKQTQRKEPLRKIMEQLPLQRYFTWTQSASSERFLTAIFPELLPHADSAVQALLPDVQWHAVPAQIVPPTVGFADTVICDSLQSAAACSSQLTAAQITAYASIAQPSVQPHVQEGRKHALPLAAIVVDLGLRCATADTRRLYIVQVGSCQTFLTATTACQPLHVFADCW